MPTSPRNATLRAYQVGFGDCFLLSFHYPKGDRHVLIDFGTTHLPKTKARGKAATRNARLLEVARQIQKDCGGKLHAVVATHRHQDHLAGFATGSKSKPGPGDVIAACKPDRVIQPWTEHPRARRDAKAAPKAATRAKAFRASLDDLHRVAEASLAESRRWKGAHNGFVAELRFLGEDNISNRSAVENLMKMGRGRKSRYLHYGSKTGLEGLLPGVRVRVLGPPTLEQTDTIRSQRRRDEDEFWHLRAAAATLGARRNGAARRLFPRAAVEKNPPYARWLRRRLQDVRAEGLLQIVRILDKAMNNTSLILLFEVGGKSLLFSGDAQLENWQYALAQKSTPKLLKGVSVYKVGHHGSLNATPRSMWKLIAPKNKKALRSVVSTMKGVHGSPARDSEVPRETLVRELRRKSTYFTTEKMKSGELVQKIPIGF